MTRPSQSPHVALRGASLAHESTAPESTQPEYSEGLSSESAETCITLSQTVYIFLITVKVS